MNPSVQTTAWSRSGSQRVLPDLAQPSRQLDVGPERGRVARYGDVPIPNVMGTPTLCGVLTYVSGGASPGGAST